MPSCIRHIWQVPRRLAFGRLMTGRASLPTILPQRNNCTHKKSGSPSMLASATRSRSHRDMLKLPNCPSCDSEYTYEDGSLIVCPDCAHEFTLETLEAATEPEIVHRDAFGTALVDGDTVTVIKDLKVGGTSSTLKIGTKVKNIRFVAGDHDIDCKIKGFGGMKLKSEFVKKA